MSKFLSFSIMSLCLACAATSGIDTSKLDEVAEYHEANFSKNGRSFDARTFIKPFEQPYYVLITAKDGAPIAADIAEKTAIEYLRGHDCKENFKRRKDLDKSSENGVSQLIGVAC